MDIEDIKLMKDPDCYARMRLGIGLYPWQEKILRAMSPRGSRVAVLFWNPNCGYCREMLESVRAWESKAAGGSPRLFVVSTGGVEENRAQGFRSPVAIDGAFATGRAFGAEGTPSAVVVAPDGTIGSELAVGSANVLRLLDVETLER